MIKKKVHFILCLLFTFLLCMQTLQARDIHSSNQMPIFQKPMARPATDGRVFNVGTLWNTVTNRGQYGHTEQLSPSMEWPGGSEAHYLWEGRFWIGAILNGEKCVTHADYGNYEWLPKEGSVFQFGQGKAILDSYVEYDDISSITGHIPLGLEVHETGLAWSMGDYDDFIIYEYEVLNVGTNTLNNMFISWCYDCDICAIADPSDPNIDDLVDYEGWDGTESNTDIVDWVDPMDLDQDGETGYDEWGWPYAYPLNTATGPRNPNYDASKVEPDGFYDEWAVILDDDGPVIYWQTSDNWAGAAAGTPATTMDGDTLLGYLFPRSASFMYDGDHASTPEMDIGERNGSQPIPGFIWGQLIYSDIINQTAIFPYQRTVEDTFLRAFSHQWWNWESDPGTDIEKYDYMAAQHSASTQLGTHYYFLPNPFDVLAPVFDYRWITSTGPFHDFQPGEKIKAVYAVGLGLGFEGMRENMDNAIRAYYAGSKESNPYHPVPPDIDDHYVLPIPPPVPNLTYSPMDAGVRLAWDNSAETEKDAMLGMVDFEGYKIYRSLYNPSNWEMIAAFDNRNEPVYVLNTDGDTLNPTDGNGKHIPVDLPDIVHTYTDIGGTFLGRQISRPINGLKYFYSIVAYDPYKPATSTRSEMISQESAKSNYLKDPESGAPLEIIPNGLYTESVESYNTADMVKIKVVPNPYRGTALFESRYEDKIMFTNLPPACKIQIFTINGDLVDTIYHDTGDKMHVWELITRNQQKVVSGLYIYTVEIEKPESQKFIGKFVIIR
ncbi:hypothetical protein JW824_14620 [bacterium]|nr:hypothetical protein [bacterium]RQV93454.1 MAG: hypothetical protein EH221_09515 [bacterium]